MAALFAQILPLALGAAVSPTLLVANLLVLSSPDGARAKGLAFLVGAAGVLAGVTVLAMTVLHVASGTAKGSSRLGGGIDLVGAVLLALLGARTLRRPPKAGPSEPRDHSLPAIAGLGVALMATNFTTLLLYIPAAKDISIADVGVPDKVAAVAFLYVVTMAVVWVPLLMTVVSPVRAGRALGSLNRVVTAHARTISVVVCFAFAAYLAFKGLRIVL